MLSLVLSAAWCAFVACLIFRAVRQYGAYEQLAAERGEARDWPGVAVIVPARNERLNIEPCLKTLLGQDYPREKLRIIVVDDGSSDGTGVLARRIAEDDPRVRVMAGRALPQGWKGKPFACRQGVEAIAADEAPHWLCFMDCDTRAAPGLLRAAVARCDAGIDFLSLEPFQELVTFGERLLIPAGLFLLAFSQDLRRVNDPADAHAAANGQFILVKQRVYRAVGGHASVRARIAEDSALARRVKEAGFVVALIGAEKFLCTRMYRGWSELWEGLSKNLIEMVGGRGRAIGFSIVGLMMAIAAVGLPALAAAALLNGGAAPIGWTALALALAGSLALLGMHVGGAVYLRIPAGFGLLFPLGYVVGAGLGFHSVWIRARRRIAWKGRVYAGTEAEA